MSKISEEAAIQDSRGSQYMEQGKYKKAEKCFKKALKIDPKFSNAWHNLGTLYMLQTNMQEAERCFKKALDLTPNNAMVMNGLGAVYMQQQKLREAEAILKKATSIAPSDSTVWNNLGLLYIQLQNLAQAKHCFEKLVVLTPDDQRAWNNLGFIQMNLQNDGEAERCFKKALTLLPAYPSALCNFGEFHLNRRNFTEAKRCFEKALKIDPSYQHALEGLNKLAQYENSCPSCGRFVETRLGADAFISCPHCGEEIPVHCRVNVDTVNPSTGAKRTIMIDFPFNPNHPLAGLRWMKRTAYGKKFMELNDDRQLEANAFLTGVVFSWTQFKVAFTVRPSDVPPEIKVVIEDPNKLTTALCFQMRNLALKVAHPNVKQQIMRCMVFDGALQFP
ncbi:MAG: tetratricopeptide repeat protein [Candidatus Helarchaeota archaeon]|nr:tetratricopeptide repeat protein [Candidatus Helarchaeota archaeon]